MDAPRKQIPPERRNLYYLGMGVAILGALSFFSVFVTFLANFGNFDNFEGRVQSEGFRAIGGMFLIVVGSIVMNIGARGWAGSGVVLDPERARKEVEPWSRLAGGVTQDALSEIPLVKKLEDRLGNPEPQVVKVRCRQCQGLNDETARFCNQCGAAL